jgi:hypothetical protein
VVGLAQNETSTASQCALASTQAKSSLEGVTVERREEREAAPPKPDLRACVCCNNKHVIVLYESNDREWGDFSRSADLARLR